MNDRSSFIVPNFHLITKMTRDMTMSISMGRAQLPLSVTVETDVTFVHDMSIATFAEHDTELVKPAPSIAIDSLAGYHAHVNSFTYISTPCSFYGLHSHLLLLADALHRDGGHCIASDARDALQSCRVPTTLEKRDCAFALR
ncbi:hypothetical protein [Xanthomonas citri]|uniref:hypothetical protein n=1 Tax=Xanthomonas citri TaxID=346 RepID=UPI0001CECA12|nr:hypothetical protein [Xanthomonas citri]EFF43084.1 conserved hypothetical protein [Xanthomonas citri pv. aurantifolii str. ICPB 11122]